MRGRSLSILLTGGSGFVGLNVAELLLARGDDVVLFAATPPPEPAVREFSPAPGRLAVVIADVTDGAALDRAMRAHQVDRVIHAAAITAGAERDKREARRIAEVNLLGTIETLEAARRRAVRRFIQVSTGSVYGRAGVVDGGGFLEEDEPAPVPQSLYGITKYAAERTALRYRELFGMDVVAARLATVFGRWEFETGVRDSMSLVLQATRLAEAGREAVLPAGLEMRDWIYAPDAARALAALLDAERPSHDVYNVGTGRPWTVAEWCDRLKVRYPAFSWRETRRSDELTVTLLGSGGRSPFAARRLRGDIGFVPRYGLDDAFADYMAWRDAHPLAARPAR
jgi:dTDP-glucose 4,6-dehydratase